MSEPLEPDPSRERELSTDAAEFGNGRSDRQHDEASELERVRSILLGRERAELARLEKRVDELAPDADQVARVLPDAIRIESKRGDRLARSLAPTVEVAVQESVRRNPKALADAIFPIIGPAIRNSVEAMLAAMVDRLNRAVDHSLSPRSIGWRIEAWRTNRSFGEVVLLKSLVYRVEQVLLLRTDSGLLVKHVAHPAVAVADPDLVAGMLTAINDFVADSFAKGADQALEHVEYADKTLELVRGPRLTLAAHVRGQAPRELRLRLQALLEELHLKVAELEAERASDETLAAELEPALARALETQERENAKKQSGAMFVVLALAGAALVLLAVWGILTHARRAERFDLIANVLRAQPGYVVLAAERNGERMTFEGLRDPLAPSPEELAQLLDLDFSGATFTFEPYASLDRSLVAKRVLQALTPPPSVDAQLVGDRIVLSGQATHAWIELANSLAKALGAADQLDATRLVDLDLEALRQAIDELPYRAFVVSAASFDPKAPSADNVHGLAAALQRVDSLARAADRAIDVRVVAFMPETVGVLPALLAKTVSLESLLLTRVEFVDSADHRFVPPLVGVRHSEASDVHEFGAVARFRGKESW
ncbi:MAG: hypothetical protein L6Q99_02955 [Planctomycetes bacterium]|nr:hypothetical protein [Planctomycetota bacterium]